MKKGTKKVFAWVMTFALLLSLVPAMGVTALAATTILENVSYRYPNYVGGDAKNGISGWATGIQDCKRAEPTKIWGETGKTTWYAADTGGSYSGATVVVYGDVHLILMDGIQDYCVKNIVVNSGSSLTIYGQEAGTGKLIVGKGKRPEAGVAGIGSTYKKASGPITINGGTVTAYGGNYTISGDNRSAAAGIGGGGNSTDSSNITINGGNVTAIGGYGYTYTDAANKTHYLKSGAGIGGGGGTDGSNITINGGTVTATGGNGGAGIGGGSGGAGKNITINDGKVTATGTGSKSYQIASAGIGGGSGGAGQNITINGGTVTASGGYYYSAGTSGGGGAGIGGGMKGAGQNITVNGGTVTATGGWYGAGIGGGGSSGAGGMGQNITINGGTVTATGQYLAAGIGGGYRGAGDTIAINGGTVTATGGDNNGSVGSGIGSGYSGSNSKIITVAESLVVKAGSSSNPTAVITYPSGGDYASALKGKQYAIVEGRPADSGTEWTGTDTLPPNGTYYLMNDVIVTKITELTEDLDLDLNGHAIKRGGELKDTDDIFDLKGHNLNLRDSKNIYKTGKEETTATCDNPGKTVGYYYYEVGNTKVWIVTQKDSDKLGHKWGNTSSENTINHECERCKKIDGTLTIHAPANLTYDGTTKEATVTGSIDNATPTNIVYSQGETTLSGAPTEVGSYVACITLGDATASVPFDITSKTHTEIWGPMIVEGNAKDSYLHFQFQGDTTDYRYPETIEKIFNANELYWNDINWNIPFYVKIMVTDLDETEHLYNVWVGN